MFLVRKVKDNFIVAGMFEQINKRERAEEIIAFWKKVGVTDEMYIEEVIEEEVV